MPWAEILWVAGGYVAGTLPSTYLIARAKRATPLIAAAHRNASEGDAHVLMTKHLGGGWSALAAALDVAKGFVYPLAARRFGQLPPEWLALVGVAIVVGHGWPPYIRALAGRGLSAASGVLLVLLPLQMVVTGLVILVGIALHYTGPASTLGFGSAAPVAAIQGQPSAYVAMAGAIVAVIMLRRLEGVSSVIRRGGPWYSAVYYRAVWDVDGPPPRQDQRGEATSPGRS
jgi:glycerol-3-phosphate acyltransferase PlsY